MRTVAIDLETRLIGAGNLAPLPIVLSIADANGNRLTKEWRREAFALLSDPHVMLVGHNIAFDLGCLFQHAPELRPLIWAAYDDWRVSDTGIRDRIILLATGRRTFDAALHVRPSFSLSEAVRRNLPDHAAWSWWADEKHPAADASDAAAGGWRTRYSELEKVALVDWPEAARAYALADSLLTLRVWEAQRDFAADYLDSPLYLRNEADQVQAAWALHLISAWGLQTDGARTEEYATKWNGLLTASQDQLAQSGLIRSVKGKWVKDTAAIRARVAVALAAKSLPVVLTPQGEISTEREVLEDTDDPLLHALAEQTKVEKLLGTYLPVLRSGVYAPIHTRYEVLIETGRTSSSKPNLQNIPRDSFVRDYAQGGAKTLLTTREAFVPRAGYNFVSVDYDTLELRTLAQAAIWLTGQSHLAGVLNDGLDPHLDLAALMLGVSYDDAKARKAAGDKGITYFRTLAKAANFGFPGGLSANSFGDYAKTSTGGALRLTRTDSQNIKNYWAGRWREMPAYFRAVESCRSGDYYTVEMFRTRLVRANCTYTAACNTYFQALAAHGAKRACYAAVRAAFHEPNSPFYGSRPAMFVHDEIIAEVPEDRTHEAGVELSRIMCEAMQGVVPDVKITASPAAMRRWYKEAATVYDANGRLVPWEPKP
jgi:hypothetical protein